MATEKRSLSIEARVTDLATSAFTKMAGSARQFASVAVPLFKATAIAVGSVAAAGTAAFVAFRHYAEGLDKLAKVSDKFGVTAESLTAIRNGAELAGVDIDNLATSMLAFEKAVAAANSGSEQQSAAFQRLGIDAAQFAGGQLDIVEVLSQVAGGLQGIGSAADRTRVLVELFGKSGADLAPLLKAGSAGIEDMAAKAKAAGAVFTRAELQKVEDFNDAWTELQQTFRTIAERVTSDLSPAMAELFKVINATLKENSDSIVAGFRILLRTLTEGIASIELLVKTARSAYEDLKTLAFGASALSMSLNGMGAAADAMGTVFEQQAVKAAVLRAELMAGKTSVDGLREAIERLGQKPAAGPLGTPEQMKAFEEGMRKMGAGWAKAEEAAQGAGETFARAIAQPEAFAQFEADMKLMREGWEKALAKDPWARFNKGADEALRRWRDLGGAMEEAGGTIVNGTLNGMTDALAEGFARTKSWEKAFQDFGRSAVAMLTQVLAKLVAVQAVSAVFGSSSGTFVARANGGVDPGVVTRTLPLRGFATGGIVREPTLALMGEGRAPAEAFVPLPDGKSIPVSFRGGGAGGGGGAPPVVNVTFNNTFQSFDPKTAQELFNQELGRSKNQITTIVVEALQRSNAFRGAVKEAAS